MVGWDSSIAFMVDGDHTGGIYGQLLGINCAECTDEQVLWNHRRRRITLEKAAMSLTGGRLQE